MTLKTIDLFAGVGGLTIGLLKARAAGRPLYDVRLMVDNDPEAAHTFRMNEVNVPQSPSGFRRYFVADIAQLTPRAVLEQARLRKGELDVLVGGPPCQGFSAAGKLAIDHSKNFLVKKLLELAAQLKPKMILMENVPALIKWNDGQFYNEVNRLLVDHGYEARWDSLPATDFGVPQLRRRAILAAIRGDLGLGGFQFPEREGPRLYVARSTIPDDIENQIDLAIAASRYLTVEDAIGDLPALSAGETAKLYDKEPFTDYQKARRGVSQFLFNHEARGHAKDLLDQKLRRIEPGGSNKDLPRSQRFEHDDKGEYYSQAYGRLHPKMIAQTITTAFMNPGSGRFTHYRDVRSITVREAARIQSFDDSFIFHGDLARQQRHVGNAVPPLMARGLGEYFGRLLAGDERVPLPAAR
ncbi:DNA (cytosine-5-)-methyltransferase [mine drainage metagenome]|uniref:DNA (cytosine-5-)-methyltransferase n=1 Tax=mine drainage metagenome TaxID=410659 RepID=T1C681_9ZZZZ